MILLVAAVLVILSVGVVAYPFLKNRFPATSNDEPPGRQPYSTEVDAALDAIRTLQLEHQLGNVPEELYREQLQAYRVQAASSLRQEMEGLGLEEDRELEQEVLMTRLAAGGDGGRNLCFGCGRALGEDTLVCGACGRETPSPEPGNGQGLVS